MGMVLENSVGVVDHLLAFCEVLGGRVCSRKRLLIWLSTGWAISSVMNDFQFNAIGFQVGEVVHRAKFLSWLWNVLGILENDNCNYMLWCHWPIDFLNLRSL